MKRIIISGTKNEYEVEDEIFIISEGGIMFYIYLVQNEDGTVTTLQVPTYAVVEIHGEYDEEKIDRLRHQCELARQRGIEAAKISNMPVPNPADTGGYV